MWFVSQFKSCVGDSIKKSNQVLAAPFLSPLSARPPSLWHSSSTILLRIAIKMPSCSHILDIYAYIGYIYIYIYISYIEIFDAAL